MKGRNSRVRAVTRLSEFDLIRRPRRAGGRARFMCGRVKYDLYMRRCLFVRVRIRMRRTKKNILFRVEYMHERDAWLYIAVD